MEATQASNEDRIYAKGLELTIRRRDAVRALQRRFDWLAGRSNQLAGASFEAMELKAIAYAIRIIKQEVKE